MHDLANMQKKLTTKSSYMARLAESFRFLSSSNILAILSSFSLSLSAACRSLSAACRSLSANCRSLSSKAAWVFALSASIAAYNTTR